MPVVQSCAQILATSTAFGVPPFAPSVAAHASKPGQAATTAAQSFGAWPEVLTLARPKTIAPTRGSGTAGAGSSEMLCSSHDSVPMSQASMHGRSACSHSRVASSTTGRSSDCLPKRSIKGTSSLNTDKSPPSGRSTTGSTKRVSASPVGAKALMASRAMGSGGRGSGMKSTNSRPMPIPIITNGKKISRSSCHTFRLLIIDLRPKSKRSMPSVPGLCTSASPSAKGSAPPAVSATARGCFAWRRESSPCRPSLQKTSSSVVEAMPKSSTPCEPAALNSSSCDRMRPRYGSACSGTSRRKSPAPVTERAASMAAAFSSGRALSSN
mmetsp:Transcript_115154/g.320842  ORF Transcript_115154/g.320842 Transcript_115154/m.320842 type:complete len:325 (+) Transcript_115154:356-1330(+)